MNEVAVRLDVSRPGRLLASLILLLIVCLGLAAPASAQATGKSGHADATLLLERSTAMPGDSFLGALRLKMAEGWHVYWINPGDSGLPPTATWANSPDVTAGEFKFPTPHAIPLATLMNYGYEHEVVLPFDVKVAPGAAAGAPLTIGAKFEYLICADICIPEDVTLSVSLPIGATPSVDDAASKAIADTLPSIPVPLIGQAVVERSGDTFRVGVVDASLAEAVASAKSLRFFPYGSEILHPAPQTVRTGPDGVSVEMKANTLFAKPGDNALGGIIGIETADGKTRGWEVPATPGVIPASVTTTAFAAAAPVEAAPMLPIGELLLTLGLAFLGGLVLNLMPCVLPVLTIKAAGLVHTAHDPKQSRAHGLAYLAGVIVCFAAIGAILIALKAAGDTSAGLGFQLQYSWVVGLFALVMFAVGLNMLGVFEMGGSLMGVGSSLADRGGTSGAFFTGLLAAFVGAPCVGPFMAGAVGAALVQPAPIVMLIFIVMGLGLAAPFALLSFTPALAKVLPKPGKWMVTFKQVLAFPMFATALWLLWVLGAQAGTDGVIFVLGGAIVLTFGIWLSGKIGARAVGRVAAGLIILSGFALAPIAMNLPKAEARVAPQEWSGEQVSQLQSEGRVIFVDFTAKWCVTCQVNKGAMYDPAVQQTFADLGVAFLEADWTNKDSVIADELKRHGAGGIPLYLVYPAGGGPPKKFDGLLTPGMIQQAVREAAGSI
jgi:thiol:disulfide interchange protein/DsbC/DsbD-like thiol-disulfide interchange protein